MRQQLAHVVVTFLHSFTDAAEHLLNFTACFAPQRVLEHLHLDVQERQRLGDRIMQFAREQAALLEHGQLAVARHQPLVLNSYAEMLAQRFEQLAILRADRMRCGEIKVEDPQQLALEADRQYSHRTVLCPAAICRHLGRDIVQLVHRAAVVLRSHTTQALTHVDAAFAQCELAGQPFMCIKVQAAVGVHQPHRAAGSTVKHHQLAQEPM